MPPSPQNRTCTSQRIRLKQTTKPSQSGGVVVALLSGSKETVPQIADEPLSLAPHDALPIGPSLRSVCIGKPEHLTCPLVSSLCLVLSVVHQAHVSPLSRWVAPLARPSPAGYDFPLPFGGWPSLLGPSCPAAELGRPCRWLTGTRGQVVHPCQTATGFPRSTWMRCDGGGCPLYPGALVSHHNERTAAVA